MVTTREELRDHLIAVIEAAPELPPDGREQLADVFLDELEGQYRLIPRPAHQSWVDDVASAWNTLLRSARAWLPVLAAGFGLLFVLPLLLLPFFILFHAPFLILILVFLVLRFGGRGMRSHRMYL